ncbi:Uncharacterised protein [Mycobacteroides abscessus subsp. abscessus]|nr:Uncharacterised protein [Mycobacteroides abscessus subsp. abscessus]
MNATPSTTDARTAIVTRSDTESEVRMSCGARVMTRSRMSTNVYIAPLRVRYSPGESSRESSPLRYSSPLYPMGTEILGNHRLAGLVARRSSVKADMMRTSLRLSRMSCVQVVASYVFGCGAECSAG